LWGIHRLRLRECKGPHLSGLFEELSCLQQILKPLTEHLRYNCLYLIEIIFIKKYLYLLGVFLIGIKELASHFIIAGNINQFNPFFFCWLSLRENSSAQILSNGSLREKSFFVDQLGEKSRFAGIRYTEKQYQVLFVWWWFQEPKDNYFKNFKLKENSK
jgi:hypothetical protein